MAYVGRSQFLRASPPKIAHTGERREATQLKMRSLATNSFLTIPLIQSTFQSLNSFLE